jgi:hypothetical protein
VSTILEALRDREPKLTPAGGSPIHWADPRDWSPLRWVLIAGLAVAAASVAPILGGRDASAPRRPEPHADLQQPTREPAPAARPPAAPRMPDAGEPPRARVERWRPSAPPPVAAAPPVDEASTPSAPATGPAVAAPVPEAATVPTTPRVPRGPQPEPAVRLRSIGYVTAPEKRTATLTIDGAPAVTLRAGESASGIEVQLILRESVYVRHGPDVFAVGVER